MCQAGSVSLTRAVFRLLKFVKRPVALKTGRRENLLMSSRSGQEYREAIGEKRAVTELYQAVCVRGTATSNFRFKSYSS